MRALRLATFNVLHGVRPTDGLTLPGKLTEAVCALGADVLALQEVDRLQPRSQAVHQTETAARALGAVAWRYIPALLGTPNPERRWTAATVDDGAHTAGPSYGIGLVSRLPVLSWHVRRFPPARFGAPLRVPGEPRLVMSPDEPRVAVAAVVRGPAGVFTVANTHLSFVPGWNVSQLRQVVRWLGTLPGPRLLLGDLNLPGRLPARLTGWAQLARALTYPSYRPRVQLDHVLADGVDHDAVEYQTARTLSVSDHRALLVDVDPRVLVALPRQRSRGVPTRMPRQRDRSSDDQLSKAARLSRSGRASGRSVRPSRT